MNARGWFYSQPGFHGSHPTEARVRDEGVKLPSDTDDVTPASEVASVQASDDKTLLLVCCKALLNDLRGAFDAAGNPFSDPVHGEVKSIRAASALIARLESKR